MEHPDSDILLLTPGLTTTSMPKGLLIPGISNTASECAESALRDLGQDKSTAGAFRAEFAEQGMKLTMFALPTAVWRFCSA